MHSSNDMLYMHPHMQIFIVIHLLNLPQIVIFVQAMFDYMVLDHGNHCYSWLVGYQPFRPVYSELTKRHIH